MKLKCTNTYKGENIYMNSLNQTIEELVGVTITLLNGEKVEFTKENTYLDFYELIQGMSDEEAAHFINELKDKVGEKVTGELMNCVLAIDSLLDEDADFEDEVDNTPSPMQPVKMVDMDDFYSFDPDLIVEGLDKNAEDFAYAMGMFNSGFNASQVFALLESKNKRQHELELAKMQQEFELKIADKQIENSKIQADLAKTQIDLRKWVG